MAVTDINFSIGDIQNFIVEIPAGSLTIPTDICVEGGSSSAYPVEEIKVKSNIFIMND
jgi:hypothetical protein